MVEPVMTLTEKEIIEKLEKIDTPTISNIVATYPRAESCMKLYDAWYGAWYTDQTIKCMYPEMGSKVGYVSTVVFCEKSEKYTGMSRWALPEHIDCTKKPVVLVAEQQFPPELVNRVGLFGEIMTTQYKALGVIGVITNGPMRDIDAIKAMNFQYYATGVTPGHGDFMIKAVDIPVTVGGMTVMPGDMVHMDLHGVVKFPATKMEEILERATKLLESETSITTIYKDPEFTLRKWKQSVDGTKSY
jgi:4-hydroxy-4-methyl-2-oxoglutarate aldolase